MWDKAKWVSISFGFILAGCSTDLMTYSAKFKDKGMEEYRAGDYTDAAGAFSASGKQNPTDYQTQYYLGSCYQHLNEFEQAIYCYKLSLKLAQNSLAGRQDAITHQNTLDGLVAVIATEPRAEAEINTLQSEAASTHSTEDYLLLGRIFARRGDADSAINMYRIAFSLSPDDFGVAKEFGMYLKNLNQTTEAARVLSQARSLNPSDAEVQRALSSLGVPAGR